MVTSETVPFSKSGGLADVIGALSFALAREGVNVEVLMPMYSFIDERGFKKGPSFTFGMFNESVSVCTKSKRVQGVKFTGISHPFFTERKGIYGDTSFSPYQDNAKRFALFSLSVLPYLKASGNGVDIIHCHDWTTGLIPYIVRTEKRKIKTVYTIHNLAYQGEFSKYDAILSGLDLDENLLTNTFLSGKLNMMKAGLIYADRITTVSPSYAEEIMTSEQGCSLDGVIRTRKKDLSGIINGIDYKEWNPETDRYFSQHYSAKSPGNKKKLKEEVLKEFGLRDAEKPLFAMISRLAEQKGFSEILSSSPSLLERILEKKNSNFIVVGTGDKRFEEKIKELDNRYENMSARIVFSNETAHRVEGAADFFLMPSRYEPCGLNQMYSLHYGTLPVVHATGGLKDTVKDVNEDPENGQGFTFQNMKEEEILDAVERAIAFYCYEPEKFMEAVRRGMREDFTWARSAQKYKALYSSITGQGGAI